MDKNTGKIIGTIILAGILLFVVSKFTGLLTSVPPECYGASYLSIDKVDLIREGNRFDRIRVTAVADGTGECMRIFWSDNKLEEQVRENEGIDVNIERSVRGYVRIAEAKRIFTATSSSLPSNYGRLYKFVEAKLDGNYFWRSYQNCEEDCKNKVGWSSFINSVVKSDGFMHASCYCFYKKEVAKTLAWSDVEKTDIKTEFGIDGLGSKTSSGETIELGNGRAVMRWVGDLSARWQLHKPHNFHIVFYEPLRKYTLKSDEMLRSYSERFADTKYKIASSSDLSYIRNQITAFNNIWVDTLTESELHLYQSEYSEYIRKAYVDGKKLVVILKKPSSFPMVLIDLDADWVGIEQSVTKPKLYCPSYQEGATIKTSVKVCNKGNAGGLTLTISCPGVSASIFPTFLSLRAGECDSAFIAIDGEPGKKFTCTIVAKDKIDASSRDSCTFSGKISEIECEPHTSWCSSDGMYLYYCTEYAEIKKVYCKYGCEQLTATKAECRESPVECKVDSDCKGKISCVDGTAVCKNNKCVCIPLSTNCKNCFDWLFNNVLKKALGKEPSCSEAVIIEKKWYNPITWVLPSGGLKQSHLCPIFFLILFGVLVIIITGIIKALKSVRK